MGYVEDFLAALEAKSPQQPKAQRQQKLWHGFGYVLGLGLVVLFSLGLLVGLVGLIRLLALLIFGK